MKRLLLAAALVTGLAVGVVPDADATTRCTGREMRTARDGEGFGASNIIDGGASYLSQNPDDPASPRVFRAGVVLADGACNGVDYHILVIDPGTGVTLLDETVTAPAGETSVTLANEVFTSDGPLDVAVWTSSMLDGEIDRAPNRAADGSDTFFSIALGAGGGQGWN
jgi:hypothetical protein